MPWAGREDQGPHLLHGHPLDLRALALGVEAGAAEDGAQPLGERALLDGAGQRGEERVRDGVDDHADRVAGTRLE